MNHPEEQPVPTNLAPEGLLHLPQPPGLRSLSGPHGTFGSDPRERLQWAQKMETLGRLATRLAHEINNQITLALGRTTLMLAHSDIPLPLHSDVADIHHALERVADLMRRWLTLSRKETREPRCINLNLQIRDLVPMLQAALGDRIDLLTELLAIPALVLAQPGQMEQLLINLAFNARDAMPQGGMLAVTTKNAYLDETAARNPLPVPPGPYLQLTVRDSGCGMDPDTVKQVFEPFFTTKPPGQGTGMGLYTVRETVKECGGTLRVTSSPGQGTTFSLFFPPFRDQLLSPTPELSTSSPPPAPPTILVIGAEEVVRRVVRDILIRDGYAVLEANHGPEAVRLCRDGSIPIHLLILDSLGPRMMEAIRPLRNLYPGLKVVHLVHDVVDPQLAESADPATAFLSKPFLAPVLADKVRALLNQ